MVVQNTIKQLQDYPEIWFNPVNIKWTKNLNPTISDKNNNVLKLTPPDEVVKVETIQALKVVSCNYSFASKMMMEIDFDPCSLTQQ